MVVHLETQNLLGILSVCVPKYMFSCVGGHTRGLAYMTVGAGYTHIEEDGEQLQP